MKKHIFDKYGFQEDTSDPALVLPQIDVRLRQQTLPTLTDYRIALAPDEANKFLKLKLFAKDLETAS